MLYFDCTKLIKLRNKLNISQRRLAEKLEVNQTTVNRWESGAAAPNANHLVVMARIFEMDIIDFYSIKPLNISN